MECESCKYYNKDEEVCGAFECYGIDCPPLPCEEINGGGEVSEEEILENGKNHNWEYSDDRIICPWCGYEKLVEYDCYFGDSCPDVYEEGSEDLTCPECGHRFTLTKEIQWEYTTEVIPDESIE